MSIHTDIKVPRFKNPYNKGVVNIIYTGHWLVDAMNQALKGVDLTEPQYNVLSSLYGAGDTPLNVSQLQQRMVQKSSNVTRIIDKLLRKNLVDRQICPENRRKVNISITDEGKNLFRLAREQVWTSQSQTEHRLSDEELDLLSALLDKLRDSE
ncbi:MAG: MarR family transcriptional regulator [Spirochaetales bacterium]|nr:MarR family transcriptional regulator [Spirochaetales bacterium]